MSNNPKRRLLRHALRESGWRTEDPKSGRPRGATKRDAAESVAAVIAVQHAQKG